MHHPLQKIRELSLELEGRTWTVRYEAKRGQSGLVLASGDFSVWLPVGLCDGRFDPSRYVPEDIQRFVAEVGEAQGKALLKEVERRVRRAMDEATVHRPTLMWVWFRGEASTMVPTPGLRLSSPNVKAVREVVSVDGAPKQEGGRTLWPCTLRMIYTEEDLSLPQATVTARSVR